MIKIIADTHTHTIACDHAYSTLYENVVAAREKELLAIAMTEHTPSMPGGPSPLYFGGLKGIPRVIDGITIIKGAEVNIMDYKGALDLSDKMLDSLEWVIASLHTPNIKPADTQDHTRIWITIAKNPLVDVIGHCGDGRYSFDHEPVLKAFKENGKIVEINSHSFKARPGSYENCSRIAKLCAELEIPVVVSSDSHHASTIGNFAPALDLLRNIGFPERLILNADKERFFAAVEARKAYRRSF